MSSDPKQRISYAQLIEASLITVGYNENLDTELDYAAEILERAVRRLKECEKKVDLKHMADKEKRKAILTLNTIFALEKKFMDK